MSGKPHILLILFVFLVVACSRTNYGVSLTPADESFTESLARGYTLLAEYEDYVAADSSQAAHFLSKAHSAQAGKAVLPDEAGGFLSAAKGADDVSEARAMLMDALETFNNVSAANTLRLAEAQINYDCWLSRVQAREDSARHCKKRFHAALKELEIPNEKKFTVVFADGEAVPDTQAFATIKAAAAAYEDRPHWQVHLIGHPEKGRGKNQHMLLSMRRTVAVRNALAQQGIDLNNVVIGAVEEPAGRQKSEAGNINTRRVDILILPAYIEHKSGGPDITAIAPHYFKGGERPQ